MRELKQKMAMTIADTCRTVFPRLVPALTPVHVRASVAARFTAVAATSRRFVGDKRGGAAVQAMVMLPVFLFAFVAGVKLWQIMMIRRSLNNGTYLATRYLSLYPPATTNNYEWADVAKRFVWAELRNNPYVEQTKLNDAWSPVYVTLVDNNNGCTDKFDVTAEYTFLGPAGTPGELGLPQLSQFRLTEERRGEVLCD